MDVLYRLDPDGMGSSVGAPDDEYFDVAIVLMRQLLDRGATANTQQVALERWPAASPEMLADIEAAWVSPPLNRSLE